MKDIKNSHLIELIYTLTQEEKDQIIPFAKLPSFNDGHLRNQVIELLNICLNHNKETKDHRLEKINIFKCLFPDKEFVEGKLEKVMVDAYKVVRAFLLSKYYFRPNNEFHQLHDFSSILRQRGLGARSHQIISRLEKIQQADHIKNSHYFYRQFLLEYLKHDEESYINQIKGDLNIPSVLLSLENHCHLNRLALLNRYLLQQKVANLGIPEHLASLMDVNSLEPYNLESSPVLRINYQISISLKKEFPALEDIQTLFEMLLYYEKDLDQSSLREFYTYLRNLCVLIYNKDPQNEEINFQLHELYKDNLERGYLHYEGQIHPLTYQAVCANALWVKNYDWALHFIEQYKHTLIGENETHDIYRLNLANYLFAVGRFSECLDHIPGTSPFVNYLLHGKRLELKALYELESGLLPYKLDAFKMFLSRTSPKLLSKNHRQIHSDFANFLHQIVMSRPGDAKRSELIVSRLQQNKQAAEWRWLLEKAEALKKK